MTCPSITTTEQASILSGCKALSLACHDLGMSVCAMTSLFYIADHVEDATPIDDIIDYLGTSDNDFQPVITELLKLHLIELDSAGDNVRLSPSGELQIMTLLASVMMAAR